MSNYNIQISWSGKDALSDSDPAKVVSGSDFQTEFEAVKAAINSKAELNGNSGEDFSCNDITVDGDINLSGTIVGFTSIPAGAIIPYISETEPSGWLKCDGTAVSRTTYSSLFAVVGTAFGSGDGSTTFNLPDLRGRTVIGSGTGSGLTARTLAATGGAETHILSISEMPAHTHSYSNQPFMQDSTSGGDTRPAGSNSSYTTGSTGGGAAHNNMQPFLVLNYMIKT